MRMSLLSRVFKFALLLFLVLALTATPELWSPHSIGSWLSATPAWASGSPDETLNPHPQPPSPKHAASLYGQRNANRGDLPAVGARTQASTLRARFERFVLVARISLTFVLRF
jgi:hypothetical protein